MKEQEIFSTPSGDVFQITYWKDVENIRVARTIAFSEDGARKNFRVAFPYEVIIKVERLLNPSYVLTLVQARELPIVQANPDSVTDTCSLCGEPILETSPVCYSPYTETYVHAQCEEGEAEYYRADMENIRQAEHRNEIALSQNGHCWYC